MTTEEREANFESVFKANYKRLFSFAAYTIGDAEQARDVVGDVFERAWQSYTSVRLDDIDNYLFLSVRNKCLDVIRHQRVERNFAEKVKAQAEWTSAEWNEYDERLDKIIDLIAAMPPQTRFIMEQCYLQENTYKGVAEITGLSQSGVKKHIMKGLDTIRNYFLVNYKKGQGPKHKSERI